MHAIEGQALGVFLPEGTVHTSCSYTTLAMTQCETQRVQHTTEEQKHGHHRTEEDDALAPRPGSTCNGDIT